MSTILQTLDNRDTLEQYDEFRAIAVRGRLLGHVVLIGVLLLAICLRSL